MTIPNTKRQSIRNAAGQELERAYTYLLPSTWVALKALCVANGKPTSELIEQLILSAATGQSMKDISHESRTHIY